jgi:hypothetical protein
LAVGSFVSFFLAHHHRTHLTQWVPMHLELGQLSAGRGLCLVVQWSAVVFVPALSLLLPLLLLRFYSHQYDYNTTQHNTTQHNTTVTGGFASLLTTTMRVYVELEGNTTTTL